MVNFFPLQVLTEFHICTVVPYRVAASEGFVPYLLSTHHLLYQTGSVVFL